MGFIHIDIIFTHFLSNVWQFTAKNIWEVKVFLMETDEGSCPTIQHEWTIEQKQSVVNTDKPWQELYNVIF